MGMSNELGFCRLTSTICRGPEAWEAHNANSAVSAFGERHTSWPYQGQPPDGHQVLIIRLNESRSHRRFQSEARPLVENTRIADQEDLLLERNSQIDDLYLKKVMPSIHLPAYTARLCCFSSASNRGFEYI